MKISIIIIFLFSSIWSSSVVPTRVIKVSDYRYQLGRLSGLYGHKKELLNELEIASLVALSYYPELKDTHIVFKRKNIKTTMATRPTMGSALRDRSKRTYIVYVDNHVEKNKGLIIDGVPFNALVGLIGHEYAHILQYEQMSMWQITKLGLRYTGEKGYKCMLERNTDRMTIDRGLGWQLQDWAGYSMERSFASQKYKDYKREVYLDRHQIYNLIDEEIRP